MPLARPAWLEGWIAAEQGRFLPWLAVWMGAGTLGYFALGAEPAPGWLLASALGSVALVVCTMRWAIPRAVALCVAAAALGVLAGAVATWRAAPVAALPARAVILTGIVTAVDVLPEGRRVTLRDVRPLPDAPALPRTIRVRLRPTDPALPAPGDLLRIRAVLRAPMPPTYPGAWDLQRDAFFSGAGGSGQALGTAEIVERAAPGAWAGWWRSVREAVAARLMADIPAPQGAIAATFVTGLTAAIPPADRAAFRDAGLAHLLAVAGLHMGLVMGLVMGAVRLGLACWERAALNWPTRGIAAVAALVAGFFYMLVVGGHVPVVRSFAMAALVVAGLLAGRRAFSLRGLALAAMLILLTMPNEVNGVSFQMSFAAVAGLIAGYEALRPALARLRGEGGWRRWLLVHVAMLSLTSLLAGTASAPFAAYHFGHAQLYAVLANLVAVPITALVIMPCGLAALALMPFGLDGLAAAPMGWGVVAVLAIGRATSAMPAATLAVPHIPVWGLGLFGIGLAWLCLWRSRTRLAGLAPIVAGLAAAWIVPMPDILVSPDARVILLNTRPAYVQAASGASQFLLDSWADYVSAPLTTLPTEQVPDLPGGVSCEVDSCRMTRHGAVILLVRKPGLRPDCTGIDLVLSADPLRGTCPPAIPAIDRFTVWRHGAQAVWLSPSGVTILSDRAHRGARPWVPPGPTFSTHATTLPMAQTE